MSLQYSILPKNNLLWARPHLYYLKARPQLELEDNINFLLILGFQKKKHENKRSHVNSLDKELIKSNKLIIKRNP